MAEKWILFFLSLILNFHAFNTVSCAVGTDCVLPCDLKNGSDISIRWTKSSPQETTVHSYHDNEDQLELQHEDFRGRTFLKEIHRGEASLLLRDVRILDAGLYVCNTSSSSNTTVTKMYLMVSVTRVSCGLGTDCVLPCNFTTGSDISIHWKKTPENGTVHSYHNNEDQLQLQHKNYRGRTFLKEIHRGEASLLLRDVRIQDEGTYMCNTSSSNGSSVIPVYLQVFVACAAGTDCVLPCGFKAGSNISIHWKNVHKLDGTVHSYHDNEDQLQLQHEDYRGRTFLKEVHRGEASLLLRDVRIQDKGKYICNASSSSNRSVTTVELKVFVTEMSCYVGTDCVLPCNFTTGSDISIRWRKNPGNATVHSYHSNEDQLQLQHEDYRGRTFLKEVHRGEASLLLRDVRVQDEGRYICNTSTSTNSSITSVELKVPVFCAAGTDCVLPCDFKAGSDISIHWTRIYEWSRTSWGTVHSYHDNEDQLQLQLKDFRGRTFLKEVHRGEASLLIRDVRTRDTGAYMCNTSSSSNSSVTTVHLKVFVTEVSCAVGTDCVLPCNIKTGSDISIHWRKTQGNGTVHSYHSNQDQLQLQHEDYRGRTFLKEVHRGEASLLLRDVRIQDKGRYMCYTSGSSITTVDLYAFVTTVSCAVGIDCVLPCNFTTGSDISVHWRKTPENGTVHSYHNNEDQLQLQHEDYRGRTFLKEIHREEASLLLRDVRVQDDGRYMCNTSSSSGSSVIPVDLKVFVRDFEETVVMQGSELIFRFEGLYPEPALDCPDVKITVEQREDLLFDINVIIPVQSNSSATCSVSSEHHWRMVTFTSPLPVESYNQEAFLRCFRGWNKYATWKFNNDVIISNVGSGWFINDSWRPYLDGLTQSYNLILKDLTKDQEGFYYCHTTDRSSNDSSFDRLYHYGVDVSAIQLTINKREKFLKLSEGYLSITVVTLVLMMCGSFILGYAAHYFKKMGLQTTRQKLKCFFSSLSLSTLAEKIKSLRTSHRLELK